MTVKQDLALISTLVRREFTIRYKGSFLGIMWVFGAPLLMIATYSIFMFGIVRPGNVVGVDLGALAGLWLCLGLWQWLSEGTNRCATTFHDNAAMVKKTQLKLSMLPMTNVFVSSLGFTLPLAVSLATLMWAGAEPSRLLLVTVGILSILPWFVGMALTAAVLGTFLREVRYALPLCFNVGLFLSPILYTTDHAPAVIRPFLLANPLGHHFDFIKASASGTVTCLPVGLVAATGAGIVFLLCSIALFSNRNGEFADVV
jgi:ABC-type polysaccharide/polyol phosphate export permease